MTTRTVGFSSLLLGSSLFIGLALAAAGGAPRPPFVSPSDLAALAPADALAFVEGPGLPALLAGGLEHPAVARLLALPPVQALLARAKTTPAARLAAEDAWFGEPLLPALAHLSAGGSALSIGVEEGRPVFCLALRADDAALLERTLARALERVAERFSMPALTLVPPHERRPGVDLWFLGDGLALARAGELLLASNAKERLDEVLALGAEGQDGAASLAASPEFQLARAGRSDAATLWGWVDLAAAERAGGARELRDMGSQPAAQFLLGPALSALGGAGRAAGELALESGRVSLSLRCTELAPGPGQTLLYPPAAALPPHLGVLDGDAGSALLYRDLDALFRLRSELFPAAVLPKFSEAIANLAYLIGGADVTEEVLPGLSPWFRVVLRAPRFRAGAVPGVELPGVALLARVATPERLGPLLQASFQSAIGFVNLDGAQKMRPPMLLDIEIAGETRIHSARFLAPAASDEVDLRYNLEPACALVGDTFVLATHVDLVRALVAELQAAGPEETLRAGAAQGGEFLALSGPAIGRALRANAEALAMQEVLKKGKELAVARAEIEIVAGIVSAFQGLRLATERPAADELRASLVLQLPPEAPR